MTSNSTDRDTAICHRRKAVAALDRYLAIFPKTNRLDHLKTKIWRKIQGKIYRALHYTTLTCYFPYSTSTANKAGVLHATWSAQNVEKATLSHFGVAIATRLELACAEAYTGHCYRRTAATLAANYGLSLAQLKTLTGHKSDKVVQRYIDKSLPMLKACADATCIDAPITGKKRPLVQGFSESAGHRGPAGRSATSSSSSSSAPNYHISINVTGDISGKVALFDTN
jgi:hypothetical protein